MGQDTKKYYELCILIPCYNNTTGLIKSIDSIKYDNGNYLIVVVDDGSNEILTTEKLISHNGQSIPLHIINLPQNKGITVALNTGLQWIFDNINCDFIARLDCGDTNDPKRYYKQINYLRENTDVMLLGSWCYFKNFEKNFQYNYKAPEHHKQIKNALYFRNVFIHPTIIFRSRIFAQSGLYPSDYPHCEDYALCWTIANLARTAVYPAYLVVCEINAKGISNSNRIKQLKTRIVIVQKFGSKFAFQLLGKIKLMILMKMPYTLILKVKKLISF